jgi:hypothetical protein
MTGLTDPPFIHLGSKGSVPPFPTNLSSQTAAFNGQIEAQYIDKSMMRPCRFSVEDLETRFPLRSCNRE